MDYILSLLPGAFGPREAALWALVVLGCMAYRVVNAMGWPMILRALGGCISYRQGVQLWLLGESGRWLPGGVWGYGARLWLAQSRAGVPLPAAAASISIELMLTLVAWGVVAVGGTFWDMRMIAAAFPKGGLSAGWMVAIGAACLVSAAMGLAFVRWATRSEKIRAKVHNLLAGLKTAREGTFRWQGMASTVALYCLCATFNGVILAALVAALGGRMEPDLVALIIGANAVSWIAGFLAIAAPGGIGAREAVLAACLSLVYPAGIAIAAAVLWRVVQIAVEIVCLVAITGSLRPSVETTLNANSRAKGAV